MIRYDLIIDALFLVAIVVMVVYFGKPVVELVKKKIRKQVVMKLPIPGFESVERCYHTYDEDFDVGMVRFIALDHLSGSKNRYTVVEMYLNTGRSICIGRELPKKIAKKIAKLGLQEYYRKLLLKKKKKKK